jgi:hypothetical protein
MNFMYLSNNNLIKSSLVLLLIFHKTLLFGQFSFDHLCDSNFSQKGLPQKVSISIDSLIKCDYYSFQKYLKFKSACRFFIPECCEDGTYLFKKFTAPFYLVNYTLDLPNVKLPDLHGNPYSVQFTFDSNGLLIPRIVDLPKGDIDPLNIISKWRAKWIALPYWTKKSRCKKSKCLVHYNYYTNSLNWSFIRTFNKYSIDEKRKIEMFQSIGINAHTSKIAGNVIQEVLIGE